jgi:hypothetical protein
MHFTQKTLNDEGLPIRLGSIKTWTLFFGIFDIFAMGRVYVFAVLLNTAIYHPFNEKSGFGAKLGIINVYTCWLFEVEIRSLISEAL